MFALYIFVGLCALATAFTFLFRLYITIYNVMKLQVFFNDGSSIDKVAVDIPIGHRERREEGIPVLKQKFVDSVSPRLATKQWQTLNELCADREKLAATAVDDFMALLVA